MKHNILYIFIVFLFLVSCERELTYRGQETQPLMVVECLAQAGDTLSLKLSHSRFFLDSSPIKGILDADVQYQVNDGEWQSMNDAHLSDQPREQERYAIYSSAYVCNEGDEINITITHKDYPDVSMTQVIVPKPIFTASLQTINTDESRVVYHLEKGNLPEDAVIQVQTEFYIRDYSVWENDTTIDMRVWLSDMICYDPILGKANNESDMLTAGQYTSCKFYIPVSAINESHDLEVYINAAQYIADDTHWMVVDSVCAHGYSMSADYYRYEASKDAYSASSNFGSFFAEKVQIYSNVTNGIGIFGSYGSVTTKCERY